MTQSWRMYHRTTSEAAAVILSMGFRDGSGAYLTDQRWRGIWLSNTPLDSYEGATGNASLEVVLAIPAAELLQYEWIEEGKPYREWLIPAAIVNAHAQTRQLSREEEGELPEPESPTGMVFYSDPLR